MSGNFDWYTEEDESRWAELPGPESTPPKRSRRWPFLLAALCALTLIAVVVFRQVNQRVSETENRIEEDVLAARTLIQRAASESDRELLTTMLSGREPRWTRAQQELMESGILFGNAGIPFGLHPLNSEPLSATVALSDNFQEAVVSEERQFAFDVGNGVTDTIVLEQTLVFREGSRRWLYSPPEEDFWGEWQSLAGSRASVAFRARDESYAVRFTDDVNHRLAELCNLQGCPPDLQVSIRLDPEPGSLLRLAAPEARLEPTLSINLPSPTLIGMPLDEAGYQALSRAYATHVVSAVLGVILEWECCDRIALYEAVVDDALAELALQSYPLQTADYLDLVNYPPSDDSRPISVWEARSLGTLQQVDRIFAHAVVAYFRSLGVELHEIQEGLIETATRQDAGDVARWTSRLTGRPLDSNGWDRFVREQVAQHQSKHEPPIPLPDQDLLLACQSDGIDSSGMFRYNIKRDEFIHEFSLPEAFFFPIALPDDSGIVLTTYSVETNENQTRIVRLGSEPADVIWDNDEAILIYLGEPIDPLGEYLTLWIFGPDSAGPVFALLELAECRSGERCSPEGIPGAPRWSPDGEQLLVAHNSGAIMLGDRNLDSWTTIDQGRSPFWLDDDTYGFLSDGNTIVYMSTLGEQERVEILDSEALGALLPRSQQRFSLAIQEVYTHQAVPNTLFVYASYGFSGEAVIFRVGLPADLGQGGLEEGQATLELSLLVDGLLLGVPELVQLISPDGRWLAAGSSPEDFVLYDLEAREPRFVGAPVDSFSLSLHDWSADSPWMAYVGARNVELLAPLPNGEIFRRIILHDDYHCSAAIWIDPVE